MTQTQSHALLAAAMFAVSAPTLAQNVTLYGRVDMSVSYQSRIFVNGKVVDQSVTALDSGGYSGSRFGFRGREDLGDGYGALFVLESGVQADTGASGQGGRLFGRQAYVGLDGPAGRVTVGRQYTPWFDALSNADPFGNNLVGNSGNVLFANARADNAVLYRTPAMGGFTGQIMHALGEGVSGKQTNISAAYQAGPAWLGAAYGEYSFQGVVAKFALVGASYDFGVVKLFANAERLRDLNPTLQAAPTPLAGARGTSWLVGATAPVGSGTVMASVTALNDQRTANRDAKQYAIGYLYPMSKRTALYAGFARIVNSNGGVLTTNTPSYAGRGEAQLQLGLSHAF